MYIPLKNKKIISLFLMASFLLLPLLLLLTMPANAQELYDFSQTDVYDYSDIYDLTEPPPEPVMAQAKTSANNTSKNIYDFSDEAQKAFDAKEKAKQIQQLQTNVYQKEKQKNKKTKKISTPVTQSANQNNEPIVDVFQPSVQQPTLNENIVNKNNKVLKGNIVYVPVGAGFHAVLQSSISSGSLAKNDTIAAVLQDDWYCNGVLIAPLGSIVYGKTIDAQKAGFAYGNGRLSITFTELLTPKGDQILLTSNVVTVQVESQRTKKITTRVVSGSLVGAVTGLLWALISGGDIANGLAIGAGVGAVGGTVRAVASRGEEVEIPAGTSISVRLTKPMNAQPYAQDDYYTE